MANAGDLLDRGEIEVLLAPSEADRRVARLETVTAADCESLLEQAVASLDAAVGFEADSRPMRLDDSDQARPFEFQEFDCPLEVQAKSDPEHARQVDVGLQIELGRTAISADDVPKIREGSVVTLDKLAGDPVDVVANGRVVARGEVLVLKDCFCVRIAEILAPAPTS